MHIVFSNLRLLTSVLPLMMLLVGSCKVEDLPGAYGGAGSPASFRLALFPDQLQAWGQQDYRPARGYIERAQRYIAGNPEAFELLSAREVVHVMGLPARRRRDADARVWQYADSDCVIDVYFYGETTGPAPALVAHTDVRRKGAFGGISQRARENCLRQIMQAAG